jgi:hypothetical protein
MSWHSRVKPVMLRSLLREQLSRALDQLTGSRHKFRHSDQELTAIARCHSLRCGAHRGEDSVLVPLTAVRGDDGVVRIRNGQRRTLGGREAGLSTMPVYVLPATATDEAVEAVEAVERIVHQIVTTDQMDDAQRARGIQQMIDAGLSATKVAKPFSVARHRESRHYRRRISHRHGCTVLGPTEPDGGSGHNRVRRGPGVGLQAAGGCRWPTVRPHRSPAAPRPGSSQSTDRGCRILCRPGLPGAR